MSSTDNPPTARSMLPQRYFCLLVWCRSCHHQAPADLQAIVDAGPTIVSGQREACRTEG